MLRRIQAIAAVLRSRVCCVHDAVVTGSRRAARRPGPMLWHQARNVICQLSKNAADTPRRRPAMLYPRYQYGKIRSTTWRDRRRLGFQRVITSLPLPVITEFVVMRSTYAPAVSVEMSSAI